MLPVSFTERLLEQNEGGLLEGIKLRRLHVAEKYLKYEINSRKLKNKEVSLNIKLLTDKQAGNSMLQTNQPSDLHTNDKIICSYLKVI